jgi:hypothetical protein
MEVPTRFELAIIELQSIALPLGYGTKARDIITKIRLCFNKNIGISVYG